MVAGIVANNLDRFFGVAFIHARGDRGRIHQMVREAVEGYCLCGIKIHCYDAPITCEVCEAARTFSLPVLYAKDL